MGDTSENKPRKRICVGLLAHVDAGKTTLSEAMLYESGSIRKMGRVDNKDAYLDTYEVEKERGITVFSKQAVFNIGDISITLLDTPGHIDFSPEMERTLQVLDYAILVINGADGVQGHTQTLWRLLKRYNIPTFLFVNKMDQNGTDKQILLEELKSKLNTNCMEFAEERDSFFENIALSQERLLEYFVENNRIETVQIQEIIKARTIFPCYFGSALKLIGIREFLTGLSKYMVSPDYPSEFGAKVFKINRDDQGNRLTFMKITGGSLKVRAALLEEKVNQIRIYSGQKYITIEEAQAGDVCAIIGLSKTVSGKGLGIEKASMQPLLQPVLKFKMILPEGCDVTKMLSKLRELEEEEPQLHIVWEDGLKEIHVGIMGEVQLEIIKSLVKERFGVEISFDSGGIIYTETIENTVEGVGHFEPLKHYAEVHLLMEPGERGSGLAFDSDCRDEELGKNWQRLILTHLEEKEHKGVLIGAPLTDIKITLVTGRAHQKHTEGGDFRQATYRAVRQGLMQASSILLEPIYEFRLEVPDIMVGRAMVDIEKMHGRCNAPIQEGEMEILTGTAPVSTMQEYQKELNTYTKGYGRLFCIVKEYAPCHNTQKIIERIDYNPDRDLSNPSSSIFCAHGAGYSVAWHNVKDYMHVEGKIKEVDDKILEQSKEATDWVSDNRLAIGEDEIDAIIEKTFYANRKEEEYSNKWSSKKKVQHAYITPTTYTFQKQEQKEEYLLVDGYNIIFAWEELKELAKVNIDSARGRLMDILCNYQAIKKCSLLLVFDAYRVQRQEIKIEEYHNIHVVFTKEAETADQYIEKFAYNNKNKYRITVVTSDGLEQIIIRGQGCLLFSAREFEEEVKQAGKQILQEYIGKHKKEKSYLLDKFTGNDIES